MSAGTSPAFALALLLGASSAVAEILEGELQQGGLAVGWTEPGTQPALEGGAAVVTNEGRLLVAVGRDFPAKGELRLKKPDGSDSVFGLSVGSREFKVQRIDGLPDRQVTPPKETLERIRREQLTVNAARSKFRHRADFSGGFDWPLKGRITGVYGSQRILNGQPRQPHYGVDVAAPVGTIVVAPADGEVTLSEPDLYFSGGTLILDHGYSLSSSFLHLSEVLVAVGETVKRGDPIAKVGATGRVTGPHLDWRMNLGRVRIDPVLVLEALPVTQSESNSVASP